MNDAKVTVEEAATLLGLSVASVRRKCAAGELPAEKVGRAWVLDRNRLPPARAGRRPGRRSASLDLDRSLAHLRRRDLQELWVPDILRYEDLLRDEASLKESAAQRLAAGGPFDPLTEVRVPKNALFYRAAAYPSLVDRLAYHACVLALAPAIEARRLDCTYSARVSEDGAFLLERGVDGYLNWKGAVRAALDTGSPWLLRTDVVGYFDNIQLRQLFTSIDSLSPANEVAQPLKRMLGEWTHNTNVGIPQGPDASRLLGNLYLQPVDSAMSRGPWRYLRYMDDIAIVGASKADVLAGIRTLQDEMRKLSLSLATKKTELLHGEDARKSLESNDLDAAQYAFAILKGSKEPARLLKRILKKSLGDEGNVDPTRARFSLYRLRQLRDSAVLRTIFARLDDLAPVGQHVAAYLLPFIQRDSVERRLADFLEDSGRNTSAFLGTWLLAAMLHHPHPLPSRWVNYARSRAQDGNEAPYLRVIAASVLGLGGDSADHGWLRRQLLTEFDPALLRGYLVGLARGRSLDAGTAKAAVKRHPDLAPTAAYLRGRSSLPSPIYAEQSTPLAER